MVPTLTLRLARRIHIVAMAAAITPALAVVAIGALASHDGGSAATVARPARSAESVAPAGMSPAPVLLPPGAVMAPPAAATPQSVYADWQINEMSARHPEP